MKRRAPLSFLEEVGLSARRGVTHVTGRLRDKQKKKRLNKIFRDAIQKAVKEAGS
jgi:hypothetical protein